MTDYDMNYRQKQINSVTLWGAAVDPHMSVVEAHDIATNVEETLRSRFGNETQTSIHIEPDTAAR